MSYDSSSIQVLSGLDGVRQRPSMYIGSTSAAGIAQLIYEIVDNSIDEHIVGYGNEIKVHVFKDGTVNIRDYGRGIPVGLHETEKDKNGNPINTLTLILTTLHAGGKFNDEQNSYGGLSSGLNGVGSSCVNALSDYFKVKVFRDNKVYQQEFKKGIPVTDVTEEDYNQYLVNINNDDYNNDYTKEFKTGTEITYHPDQTIFKNTIKPPAEVKNRFIELASLNNGLHIFYINDIDNINTEYYYENGIIGYTESLVKEHTRLFDQPVYLSVTGKMKNDKNMRCDFAFIYDDDVEANNRIASYANNIATHFGGTHVNGMKAALKEVFNTYGMNNKLIKVPIEMKYYMDGLYATISVKLPTPEFEGQTKQKLGTLEAEECTYRLIKEYFDANIKKFSNILSAIVSRAARVKDAEEAARKARAEKRAVNKAKKQMLPSQLADCINTGTDKYSEILLVEGQSAYGCLRGDTKILLNDGEKTIKELAESFNVKNEYKVYCIDNLGNTVMRKILSAHKTKHVNEIYKVELSDGNIVYATGEHLFMLEDGTYKQCDRLSEGDELKVINKKTNNMMKIFNKVTIAPA